MDSDLAQVLKLLKGEAFLQIFKEHGFDESNIKYLNSKCLDEIIPKNLYGPRLEFEFNLKRWQEDLGLSVRHDRVNSSLQLFQQTGSAATNLLQVSDNFDVEISVEDILKSSLNGRQILLYFEKNKSLNVINRKLLSSSLVEYLIEYKVNPTPKTFKSISEKIENVFLTENKDIYYIPIKGRKPAGYLYSKYHNSLSKLRKEGVYESSCGTKENEESVIFVCYENQIAKRDWLKYNVEPFDEVFKKWEETFSLRKLYVREQHSLLEILEEWPLFKQAYGYKLVTSDFSILFPEKVNLLYEKWEAFCKPILKLIQTRVQSPESLQLIQKLKESEDNYGTISFYIAHRLQKWHKLIHCKHTLKKQP